MGKRTRGGDRLLFTGWLDGENRVQLATRLTLSIDEAADALGVDPDTVRVMAHRGCFTIIHTAGYGSRALISVRSLIGWIEQEERRNVNAN